MTTTDPARLDRQMARDIMGHVLSEVAHQARIGESEYGPSWDALTTALADWGARIHRDELLAALIMACTQLHGERLLTHADTHWAVLQIRRIIRDWEERQRPDQDPSIKA